MKRIFLVSVMFLFFATAARAASPTATIKKKIQESFPEIMKHCSSEKLGIDNQIAGKMVLNWKIDDEGTASEAALDEKKSTLKNSAIQTCLTEQIYAIKFSPAPKEQYVNVSIPFTFRAAPKSAAPGPSPAPSESPKAE